MAAICAAWFAERAAAHTKRSADEAERSNVELIANLVPFDILVQADNGLHDLVKFKNVGKTSAEVHTLTWRLMERAPENPEWVFEDSNLEKLDFIIIADFEIAVLAIARTADNLSCFIGQLGYTDITGRERNSTFRYDRGINGWISAGGREWNISA